MSTPDVELRHAIDRTDNAFSIDNGVNTRDITQPNGDINNNNDKTNQIRTQDAISPTVLDRLYATPSPDMLLLNRSRDLFTNNADSINERIISSAKGKLKTDKPLLENMNDPRTLQPNVYYEVNIKAIAD